MPSGGPAAGQVHGSRYAASAGAPVAPQEPHLWQRVTGPVNDPWAWLADPTRSATIDYLTAENAYADRFFAHDAALVDQLVDEMTSRALDVDSAPPVRRGTWWYTTISRSDLPYLVHTRGRSAADADSFIVLDENVEAAGHDYFDFGDYTLSADGNRLLWSADTDGSEHYTLRVRDLASGTDLADTIAETSDAGTAWSADGHHIFYCTQDAAMRPDKVWRHELGADPATDTCIFHEPDERFTVGIGATRTGDWLVIVAGSTTTSECWLVDLHQPASAPRCVRPRTDGVEYELDHWGDRFAVITNLDAVDFRIMVAPVDDPGVWQPLLPHVPGQRIVDIDCFAGYAIVTRWVDAQPELVHLTVDGTVRRIAILDEPHDVTMDANPNWDSDTIRLCYQSLTVPLTFAEWSPATGTLRTVKQDQVPGVDLSDYVAERTWASAADGTGIPVDVVRRRSTPVDGTAPLLLYVYGAYETSIPPWYSADRLSLLDRGWVFALAHPRGGGELGRRWYLDGKLDKKPNTFTDTLACADHLAGRWADPDRIAIHGGSAGGLTVGACVNLAPDRFAAAVLDVPFVDVVTTMSDPSLPLTVGEWDEWGDPRTEPHASLIASYSPYDNLTAVRYPDMYVTAGLNDYRVRYYEPAKWVAKLRHLSPDTLVVFRCEMNAGHGGRTGRLAQWEEQARTMAFLLRST